MHCIQKCIQKCIFHFGGRVWIAKVYVQFNEIMKYALCQQLRGKILIKLLIVDDVGDDLGLPRIHLM